MNIAFVRGPHLNPWELQNYVGIAAHHSFVAIGSALRLHSGKLVGEPMVHVDVPVTGQSVAAISSRAAITWNRLRGALTGDSFRLSNVKEACDRPDIIHGVETYFTMSWQCLQWARKSNAKLVLTVWENLPGAGERHPLRRSRKRRVIEEADAFIAVTDTTRRVLEAEGAPPERIHVIPMGVDQTRFRPASGPSPLRTRWKASDECVVLSIGRWVEEKGVKDLFKAFGLLPEPIKRQTRLVMAGSGPLSDWMHAQAEPYGDRVRLVPFLPYEDIHELYQAADVFVLPSKRRGRWAEQFGYVLVEAMACGLPIVATLSGSIPDVVGGVGVLVPESAPRSLAQALLELVTDPDKRARLGSQSIDRARREFNSSVVSSRIESVYRDLV